MTTKLIGISQTQMNEDLQKNDQQSTAMSDNSNGQENASLLRKKENLQKLLIENNNNNESVVGVVIDENVRNCSKTIGMATLFDETKQKFASSSKELQQTYDSFEKTVQSIKQTS